MFDMCPATVLSAPEGATEPTCPQKQGLVCQFLVAGGPSCCLPNCVAPIFNLADCTINVLAAMGGNVADAPIVACTAPQTCSGVAGGVPLTNTTVPVVAVANASFPLTGGNGTMPLLPPSSFPGANANNTNGTTANGIPSATPGNTTNGGNATIGNATTPAAPVVPAIVQIDTSFGMFSTEGLTADALYSVENKATLEKAFANFVAEVVAGTASTTAGGRYLREVRRLEVSYQDGSSRIVAIRDDPGCAATTTPTTTIPDGATCLLLFGQYELLLVDESDRDSIRKQYQQATNDAIQEGKLEENIQKEDPNSPFTVSGPVAVQDDAVPGSPSTAPGGGQQQPPATTEEEEGMEWWLYLVFAALGVNVLCWFGVSGCFYMLWNKVSAQGKNPMAGGLLVGDDHGMDNHAMEEGSLLIPSKDDDREGNGNGLHMMSDDGPTEVFKDEFSSSSDGDDGMPTPIRKGSMNPGLAQPFTPGADPTASTRGESSSEDVSTPVIVTEETVEEDGLFVNHLNESSNQKDESNHVSKSGSSFSSCFQVAPKDEAKAEEKGDGEWQDSDDDDSDEEETQDEGPALVEAEDDEPEETFEDDPPDEEEEPSVQPSAVSGLDDDDNATTDDDYESDSSGFDEEDKAKEEQPAQPSEASAAQPSEASEIDGGDNATADDGFESDCDDEKESKAKEEQSAQPIEASEVDGVDNADDDFDSESDDEDNSKAEQSAQPSAAETDDDDEYENDSREGGEASSKAKPSSSLFEDSDDDGDSESDFDDEGLA